MCGICGIVSPEPRGERARELVARMSAAIVHRGPDEGSVDDLGRCVLGHRRLSVLDPRQGYQPVASESGDVVAVFNGELYNYRELRRELEGRHELRGTGDTPVLPHLYEEDGLAFLDRLHGMFALALWDAPRQRLVLARDRLGKKPLLWTRLPDGSIAFASEVKALLRLPDMPRELDHEALDAYLALQYVPGTRTALRGIEKLPPGHLLVLERGEPRVAGYWAPEPAPAEAADEEWLERVHATVTAAVRRRLAADVPLGALLSGGIDSSVVVAAMAQASSGPVRTFSIGFAGESRYDERPYARAVAERWGTAHEELVLEPDVARTLPRLVETLDEPLGDEAALPHYLVCEAARRHVTVALTGDGGDESFAGYERYAAHRLAARVPRPLARPAAAALRRLRGARVEPRSAAFRAARFLDLAGLAPAERYGRLMEVFPAQLRAELWSDEARPRVRRAGELLGPPRGRGIAGLQLVDLETYLPGDLLPKSDLTSMAHSLELRSPLLDHEVVELGLALPDRLKQRGREGKLALRRAFAAELPPEVAARGKTGFGVPISRWFREDLRGLAGDVLLDGRAGGRGLFRREPVERLLADHAAGRAEHGHRLWTLLMLELWLRTHVDAAEPAEAPPALASTGP